MTEQELRGYFNSPESTRLEFKEAFSEMPGSLFDTVVSFLNKEGGLIVLGVKDDGTVCGVSPERVEKIRKSIITASNNPEIIDPPFLVTPRVIEVNGRKVIYIQIPVSSQVHKHKGVIYDRESDADLRITGQERIANLFLRKRNHFTESTIYPGLKISDFSEKLIEYVRSLIRSRRVDHPWLEEDNFGLMRLSGLYRRDFETGEEGFTLAAALILGKDEVIQSILPAYKVEAMVRRENVDRYDDRITFRTNLLDTYSRLMEFVRTHLPDRFYLDGLQRRDLREVIFREIVANIIVHREYTNAEATSFVIYDDRVESRNPNTVRFRGYLRPTSFQPYPKNPLIGKFFVELGWVEEIGSGIKNITKFLPFYADDSLPIFIEDDTFRTILPLKRYKLEHKTNQVLTFLGIAEKTLPKAVFDQLNKLSIEKELAILEGNDAFLFALVSSWLAEGTKLEDLRMLTVKRKPTFEEWKVPSLEKKGTRLFGKRLLILLKVLIRLLEAISMDDLMEYMEYRNRKSFVDTYLKPLMQHELVIRVFPKRPRHPEQKYVTTEKGRRLIGGLEI